MDGWALKTVCLYLSGVQNIVDTRQVDTVTIAHDVEIGSRIQKLCFVLLYFALRNTRTRNT